VLADVRYNSATTEVLRIMPGLDRTLTAMLARDSAMAMQPPYPADQLRIAGGVPSLERKDAFGTRWTYVLGGDGRVQLLEVRGGASGNLFIHYAAYNDRGEPRELEVCRPRYYRAWLTFTDEDH
jgi:hypothetical protein